MCLAEIRQIDKLFLNPNQMKISEVFDDYIEYCSISLRPNSLRQKDQIFRQFWGDLHSIDTFELNAKDVQGMMSKVKEQNFAHKYYVGICIEIRAFVKWLVAEELCDIKPHRIPVPSNIDPKVDYLTREELMSFLMYLRAGQEICQIRDYAFFTCLYSTGCRISEILSLKKSDVNWREGSATVLGKGGKYRIVYFNKGAMTALLKYQKMRTDDWESLFLSHSNRSNGGYHQSTVQKRTKEVALIVGIKKKITPHTFRHTFATLLLEEGADISLIQKLLGHSDIRSTQIYLHVHNKLLKQGFQKFHYCPELVE